MRPLRLLLDSRIVFPAAIAFGLLLPRVASRLAPLIVPALVVMMTVSLAQVSVKHVHRHHEGRTILGLVLVNYFAAGLGYAALAYLFVPPEHRAGLYLLALVPPAVVVLPLSRILHGDADVGFLAEFAAYAVSLAIIPLGTLVLFDHAATPGRVLRVLLVVIVLPFVLSRILRRTPLRESLSGEDAARGAVNFAYAISFAAVVGLNRSVLFSVGLVSVAAVLLAVKIGAATLAWLATVHRMPRRVSVLYMLFASLKNGGAAIAIAVMLFGPAATAPLAVNAILVPVHIIYMERLASD